MKAEGAARNEINGNGDLKCGAMAVIAAVAWLELSFRKPRQYLTANPA
jgi:hypothetical protein